MRSIGSVTTALLAAASAHMVWLLMLLPTSGVAAVRGLNQRLSPAAQPNILLIIADQLRSDALGCAGSTAARTPNLDWLAATGARFTQHYTSTPTCTPARAALLTGRSPWGHGMLGYGEVAPHYGPRSLEMAAALGAANYSTAVRGKNHFENGPADTRYAHGFADSLIYDGLGTGFANTTFPGDFDDYDAFFQAALPGMDPLATGTPLMDWNSWRGAPYVYSEDLHPTAWTGRTAEDFIRKHAAAAAASTADAAMLASAARAQNASDGGRAAAGATGTAAAAPAPFFLKASFHRPHSPYDPPARLLEAVKPSDLPPIYAGGGCNWDAAFAGPDRWCGPSDPDAWCGRMPDNATTLSRRAYFASIAFVDEAIGGILATLNKTNTLDNTFILFTSDHGDALGDHFHWRKGYPYEATAHVPLIIRWHDAFSPVFPRGSILSGAVTELRDVLPTLLDVAGVYAPTLPLDGAPLTCLLSTPSSKWASSCGSNGTGWRPYLDLEHSTVYNNTVHWNALTDGVSKYVFNAWDGSEQLFNMSSDPHELTDLSGNTAYAAALETWRGRMVSQFEAEGRGETWVANGTLRVRKAGQTYGPNYPNRTAVTVL